MFNIFDNHQKWLSNAIPNRKIEIPDLMRDLLYKMITHFVEDDRALEVNVWEEDEGHKEFLRKIENIYFWIREERPLLVNKLMQMWDAFPEISPEQTIDNFLTLNSVSDIMVVQDHLWDLDQKTMKEIVEIRDSLVII